jgi:hypothetical protein
MPRVGLQEDFRTNESTNRFPRVHLNKGEFARLMFVQDPWQEWVHYLKAPSLKEDGTPHFEERTRRGEKVKDYVLDFIGSPLCLGDAEALRDKKADEKNCPVCAASKKYDFIAPAMQRFAANVIVYDLKPGTDQPRFPFGADILVWAFTARQYDTLLDLQKEIGDLREHDIFLECEDGKYQKYKIGFRMTPAWQGNQEAVDRIKALWGDESNRASDDQLKACCGRDNPRHLVEEDLQVAISRWNKVNNMGGPNATESPFGDQGKPADLTTGLGDLMNGNGSQPNETASQSAPAMETPSATPWGDVTSPVAGTREEQPRPAPVGSPFDGAPANPVTGTQANPAVGGVQEFSGSPFGGAQTATQDSAPVPAAATPAAPAEKQEFNWKDMLNDL